MNASDDQLNSETHARIFEEKIAPQNLLQKTSHEHPKAIILGGQPGSGKGGLARAANNELADNAVTIDPDNLRRFHPSVQEFQSTNPSPGLAAPTTTPANGPTNCAMQPSPVRKTSFSIPR